MRVGQDYMTGIIPDSINVKLHQEGDTHSVNRRHKYNVWAMPLPVFRPKGRLLNSYQALYTIWLRFWPDFLAFLL